MRRRVTVPGWAMLGFLLLATGCNQFLVDYRPLVQYFRSPEGFKEWEDGEKQLRQATEAAADRYGRDGSMDNLQAYDKAVREYLDHGFILLRAYKSANLDLPPGLEDSLDGRTDQLMDVADQYLKQGSEAMAVGIAREVVLKYSDLERMDRAQRRAEGMLMEYRYQRNY